MPIAPAAQCTIDVRFTPTAAQDYTGTLLMTDTAPNTTQGVSLVDMGVEARGAGTWSPVGSMVEARFDHTATLLPTGQVLVAGGAGDYSWPSTGADLFDPTTGTWRSTSSMTDPRYEYAAVGLADGRFLAIGGFGGVNSAEVYDARTGRWMLTGPMTTDRFDHTATLLENGQVLVAGGCQYPCGLLASAELYDPATNRWTPMGSMRDGRMNHTATLLPNGKVLVAGGQGGLRSQALDSAELYDPRTDRWTLTGSMTVARFGHTATLLPTGSVLVTGGATPREYQGSTSAELYDPRTGMWTITGSMATGRTQHAATLLPTGQVLVAGGGDGGLNLASAEVYTPLALVARPVSPVSGQTVTVTATTLGPSEPVSVYWDSTHTPPLAAGTTNGTGSFAAAVSMPPGPYGKHVLLIVGHNSHRVLQASIVRQPHLSLVPQSGKPGMITIIEGKGFGSREVVALRWDTPNGPLLALTTGTSNAQGDFYRVVRIPINVPGHHDVYAVGQRSHARAVAAGMVR